MPYAYSPNNLVQTADENSKALVRCEIALTGIEVEDGDVRGGKNRRLIWPSRNPKKTFSLSSLHLPSSPSGHNTAYRQLFNELAVKSQYQISNLTKGGFTSRGCHAFVASCFASFIADKYFHNPGWF